MKTFNRQTRSLALSLLAAGCVGAPILGPLPTSSDGLHVSPGGQDRLAWGPASIKFDATTRYVLDGVQGDIVASPTITTL